MIMEFDRMYDETKLDVNLPGLLKLSIRHEVEPYLNIMQS